MEGGGEGVGEVGSEEGGEVEEGDEAEGGGG